MKTSHDNCQKSIISDMPYSVTVQDNAKIESTYKDCGKSNKAVNESISAIDKEYKEAVTSPSILVIETNSPSSQALKSFSLKLIQIKARLHGEVK
ncbi:hypothetical protein [Candidatus Formimonas warabiya]|uniref:Uncharacterized protein n=1 Tax=Formimonas warabiya TaxID=1761012 RepID=A0A3G1KT60_FORW1|nr:hypothetical protein [Candidatus Formimonas warabiya]ATW25639.1 hypothetical protein DCMF_13485 [Candidatus Formimonas warabiya]